MRLDLLESIWEKAKKKVKILEEERRKLEISDNTSSFSLIGFLFFISS